MSIQTAVLALKAKRTSYDFVKRLAKAIGPLFIILDEAGRGFEDSLGEKASLNLFIEFAKHVLVAWMNSPMVYFVVVGHSKLMQSIQRYHRDANFALARPPLNSLSTNDIKQILSETRSNSSESETLQERFVMYVDNSHGQNLRRQDWEELYRNVLLRQQTLLLLFGQDVSAQLPVNLLRSVEDDEGREVPAVLVLYRCHLNWDGTMQKARVIGVR
ncbi:hypothetical protein L917_03536 [Phytophthora nicotianae]|uniref:Uncharacterized protein n=3 Tax=Phytophthora nicotianae TaxID=4792 RepID=V9FP16_PHYNI|nr:hypothetical protein F443_03783 [Phytophthora nicotianae P1569]ETL99636.1 hypothetical protein L917_03536 [Phytophthora nicotianae]ETO81896.1 hypothetical protein F444_03864 [Phytophthora nicotianae P1976]